MTNHDIKAAHPLPNSRADKPAPIIVKLVRISDKENIIYKRPKLKCGITIFEDMTRKNQLLLNRVWRDERVNNAWFYKGAAWCTINDRDFNRKVRVNLYQGIEDALIEARSFRGEQQRDFNIQRGNRPPRPQHDNSNNIPPPRPVECAVVHGPDPHPRPDEDIQHRLRELDGMSADSNTQVQETPMNTPLGASNTEDVNTTVHQGQQ